ncbi:hypothetical protein HJ588_17800 [Flexivirga sp. ID2601S]|uniref:FDX-ACB domain-containing protein n=1 Tax=Flexivirga aerilata TaxID=1656889 RepID=A0A849ANN5_9MICO|nr:hypothetical protein [Flexivirga aerilata]NNG41116.1 hypothetical protein [Flexivirga aerilata]
MSTCLSTTQLIDALLIRDLTDPGQGPHAMQQLLGALVESVRELARCPVIQLRESALVSTAANYDALGYAPSDITRSERYSRYVSSSVMLRSHTSAMLPPALARHLERGGPADALYAAAGLAYRRDAIDRTHTGEPHQLDLWRVTRSPVHRDDLVATLGAVAGVALPGCEWRVVDSPHSYTEGGLQLDVRRTDASGGGPGAGQGEWLELAEGGLIAPWLLRRAGLSPAEWAGVAVGIGLDRALMLRKSIGDIRLLRATDPRIARQMLDLSTYQPVSAMPAVRRDLSLVLSSGSDEELLGDRVRAALGDRAPELESVQLLSRTAYADLPEPARARLGLRPNQVNALVRLVIRPLDRTLTAAEANALRNDVYLALHDGEVVELA